MKKRQSDKDLIDNEGQRAALHYAKTGKGRQEVIALMKQRSRRLKQVQYERKR